MNWGGEGVRGDRTIEREIKEVKGGREKRGKGEQRMRERGGSIMTGINA